MMSDEGKEPEYVGRQKAVITFTDREASDEEPGSLVMTIDFFPAAENQPATSPAIQAALEVLEIFGDRHRNEVRSAKLVGS